MKRWNWLQIALYAVSAALFAQLGSFVHARMSGHFYTFTVANVVVPAIAVLGPTLAALFAKRPNEP